MIDEPVSTPIAGPVCPWCSAPLQAADTEHCPSCGAALSVDQEPEIPGVTTIEPEILARQARAGKPRRGGLMSLFVNRDDEPPNVQQPSEAELPALARPSAEVRLEMLRIELEAAGVLPAELEEASTAGRDATAAATAEGTPAAGRDATAPAAPDAAPAAELGAAGSPEPAVAGSAEPGPAASAEPGPDPGAKPEPTRAEPAG